MLCFCVYRDSKRVTLSFYTLEVVNQIVICRWQFRFFVHISALCFGRYAAHQEDCCSTEHIVQPLWFIYLQELWPGFQTVWGIRPVIVALNSDPSSSSSR